MKRWVLLLTLPLLGLLLVGPAIWDGIGAAWRPTAEARRLAVEVAAARGLPDALDDGLRAFREQFIGARRLEYANEAKAAVFDRFVLPALQAHLPELEAAWRDALVRTYTEADLRAILSGRDAGEWDSNGAKERAFRVRVRDASGAWIRRVVDEATDRNRAAINAVLGRPGP